MGHPVAPLGPQGEGEGTQGANGRTPGFSPGSTKATSVSLFVIKPLLEEKVLSFEHIFLPSELAALSETFPKADSPSFPSPELSQFPLGSHGTLHMLL